MTLPRQTPAVNRYVQLTRAERGVWHENGMLASAHPNDPFVGCDITKGNLTCGSECCVAAKEYCSSSKTTRPQCVKFPVDGGGNAVFPPGEQVCFQSKTGGQMFCMMTP
jgi:hypothetical protein